LASVISPAPAIAGTSASGSESSRPAAISPMQARASVRQPIRSAARPATGPTSPSAHSRNTRPPTAGESPNGAASSRNVTYENVPTKVKNSPAPAAIAASRRRLPSTRRRWAEVSGSRRRPSSGSSGSRDRITSVESSGSTATPASATRHDVAAVTSATPTRPTSPPATSEEM
jgi:hypothetical protein